MEIQVQALTAEVATLKAAPQAPAPAAARHVPPATPSARSVASTSASTPQPAGRPWVVVGGWPRDTAQTDIESDVAMMLEAHRDVLSACPQPVHVEAPFRRGSVANLKFASIDDMWVFFRALEAREKDTGLKVRDTDLWITTDKPLALRKKNKLLRSLADFLRVELENSDLGAIETEYKLFLVYAGEHRIARLHRETGLPEFNLEIIRTLGKKTIPEFLTKWETTLRTSTEREQGW